MNTMSGQYIPSSSIIHRLDARIKIISLFLLLSAIVYASNLGGYLFVLFVTIIVVALTKIPIKTALASIRRLKLFFIIIFLMNTFFYGVSDPLWSWGIISVSLEGIKQGARVVLNVLFIMVLGNVLTSSTTPIDMMNALGSLLKPLKFVRVPVEDVAMIISVALQFIPTLLEESDIIKRAQTARGARFESKKLIERALSFLPLIIPIFLSAFRRADELSIAMEARGYRNARERTKKAKEPLNRRDFIALASCIIICFVQIYFIG